MTTKEEKLNEFSVALGLFDYINPLCYAVTTITLIINLFTEMPITNLVFFIIGACLSMVFGLTIPTVKLLVGLKKFEFKMPVNLVFYVNTGILISGLSLVEYITNIGLYTLLILVVSVILLTLVYLKKKKFNTVAVLTGAIGYILIYTSLFILGFTLKKYVSIVLYSLAILFFLLLVMIGIKSNLKKAKVHWVIESCNVLCQAFVAIGTILLFV